MRAIKWAFRGKRKVFLGTPLAIFMLAGSAFAAWVIFSGASGSGSGGFANSTQQTAITITGTNNPTLSPGSQQALTVSETNADPSNPHSVSAFTSTFTTTPSNCAQYLSAGPDSVTGTSVPAGGTINSTVMINLAANAPQSCASGSWSVSFAGSTS